MIQRIQTIYLVIASILVALPVMLQLTLASINGDAGLYELNALTAQLVTEAGVDNQFGSFPIAITLAASLILSIYAILQFKNRKFQMTLTRMAMLCQLAIGVLVFFYADKMAALVDGAEVAYSPILAFLPLSVILYFLAWRSIKKDEALVRSADRLR